MSTALRRFSLCGCGVNWRAATAQIAEIFAAACASNLVLGDNSAAAAGALHIQLLDAAPALPTVFSVLSDSPRVRVLKAADASVVLLLGSFAARINANQTQAQVWLGEGFADLPAKEQQFALTLLMAWLLQSQGLIALHASALVRAGEAMVLTAVSGSGKSTTAWTLVAAGWQLLADDIVMLDCRSEPVLAWPLARGLSAQAGMESQSAAWQILDSRVVSGKQLLVPTAGMHEASAQLSRILFPRLNPVGSSRFEALPAGEALVQLLPAVGGLLTGMRSAEGQTQLLARLCARLPCARLHLGREVFAQPEAMARLFAGLA